MIRYPAEETRSAPKPATSTGTRVLIGCGVVVMFGIVIAAVIGLYAASRVRQFQKFRDELKTEYAALEKDHPFSPPSQAGTRIDQDRIDIYLRARGALLRAITPEVAKSMEEAIESDNMETWQVFLLFNRFYQLIQTGLTSHLQALKGAGMSAREFLWIHGAVMQQMLSRASNDPDRLAFEKTLAELESSTSDAKTRQGTFNVQRYREELEGAYRGKMPSIPALGEEFTAHSSNIHRAIDLGLASPRVMSALDDMQKEERR